MLLNIRVKSFLWLVTEPFLLHGYHICWISPKLFTKRVCDFLAMFVLRIGASLIRHQLSFSPDLGHGNLTVGIVLTRANIGCSVGLIEDSRIHTPDFCNNHARSGLCYWVNHRTHVNLLTWS